MPDIVVPYTQKAFVEKICNEYCRFTQKSECEAELAEYCESCPVAILKRHCSQELLRTNKEELKTAEEKLRIIEEGKWRDL